MSAHGRDYSRDDLKAYRQMVVDTIRLVKAAVARGLTVADMKQQALLKDWESWNSKKWPWINTEFWIERICQSLDQQ